MILSQKVENNKRFNSPEVIGGQFDEEVKNNVPHNMKHNGSTINNLKKKEGMNFSEWIMWRYDFIAPDNDKFGNIVVPYILIVCAGSVVLFALNFLNSCIKNRKGEDDVDITKPNYNVENEALYLNGRKKKLPKAINYNELFKQEIKNKELRFNTIDELFDHVNNK
jgi:hypothetical protein